ncbi:MAG: AmmeMemoRadiSam system protein B [Anaerohalosphaeraceae bacterium]|nr:AmmeMemoRadiSam system protein B [Anaerohalosphaeraceae bacterium]
MAVRKSVVAGSFYPGSAKDCRAQAADCVADRLAMQRLPEKIVAGIVPHAGWTFSGDLAGMVFAAIEQVEKYVDTFVIFGATHRYHGTAAAVYDKGSWQSPLGEIEIDEELAEAIIKKSACAESDTDSHKYEHSIEVQIPLIQYLFPKAKIVPILTVPADFVIRLGVDTAECIKNFPDKKIVCVGSTDLTHYGPQYGFVPQGAGAEAIKWAKQVNDQRFLDAVVAMKTDEIITTAVQNQSACGPGAVAATIAAAKALGKTSGQLLAHTHSSEVMEKRFGQTSDESVGYAAVIF